MSGEKPLKKKEAAARIQSTLDKAGLDTGKGSLAARAQSEADKNISEALSGQSQGQDNQGQQTQGQTQETPLEKKKAAAQIQSTLDKAGLDTGKGSLAARAQSEADKNISEALSGQSQGQAQEAPLEKKKAAAQIQSTLENAGLDTGLGSLAARAQSEADKSINEAVSSGQTASSGQDK